MWFGIIGFGMLNGFLLLPFMLSFLGPTETQIDHALFEEEEETPEDDQVKKCDETEGQKIEKDENGSENGEFKTSQNPLVKLEPEREPEIIYQEEQRVASQSINFSIQSPKVQPLTSQ